ncbi:MAG: DUF2062 domain-containing protein [Deltaproteobacteria bacterium]|jgi:uncharacterized protein (DUF2062 family)|nr:DUF2062 domain-containing protein [Deltaproteobacteria bacterium]
MWRGVGFIRQVKLMLVRFVRLRGLPEEIAKGVALGIFIGMTPTFGLQMAIALFFAYLLKENRLAAILGVWITNPITAPVIYAIEYEMGRIILGMDRASLPSEFTFKAYAELGWNILLPIWVGGLVAGIILGALSYFITLRLIPIVKGWRIPRWPRRHWHKKFKEPD